VLFTAVSFDLLPLLSLSADVLEKFQGGNEEYGLIHVDHLDKLYNNSRPTN
jgi:hypothetical protein